MKKHYKKILSLIISLIMTVSLFTGLEISSFAEDDILSYLSYKIYDGKATITGCDTSISGDVVLPDTIEGYPVVSIWESAFYNCENINSIIIPDSVKTIGDSAFGDCDSLESITIPDSVITIGAYAFVWCDSLTNITVDENNVNYSSDEYGVLFNKEKNELIQYPLGNSRTEYIIPDSVTSIGEYAFSLCDSLTSVTIPSNVTTIGYNAFSGCTSLASITIPDSVTTIEDNAFSACYNLESITIPDSVTFIGYHAFANCNSLTSVTIPDSVTSIGGYTFSGCDSLASITIPDSVTSIDEYAFSWCDSLTSITIPDSVTTIGDYAFYDCNSLTWVTIGNGVNTIGDYALGFHYVDLSYDRVKINDFVIYGTPCTAAETYANENDITFVAVGEVPEESTTEKPDENNELEIKGDGEITTDKENKLSYIGTGETADTITSMIENDYFTVVDKNGDKLAGNSPVGTGSSIRVLDKDGNTLNEYTVIVPTDIDGNGKTTAADARLALRASAKIDTIDGVYAVAADANNDKKITAMDARTILRKAAGLE